VLYASSVAIRIDDAAVTYEALNRAANRPAQGSSYRGAGGSSSVIARRSS
jgi:hypothetical protein